MGLLGGAQVREELGADQGPRELGEQLQVLVVGARRGGDADDEVRRPVGRSEVDRLGQAQEAQRRLMDRLGAAVGDREAAGHARGEGFLALEESGFEAVAVRAAGGGDQIGHQTDHGVLVTGRGHLQADQLGGHQ